MPRGRRSGVVARGILHEGKKLKYGIVRGVGDVLHAKQSIGRARFFAWLLGRREQDKSAIDEFQAIGQRLGARLSDRIQAGMTLQWESDPCTAWIAFLLRSEGLHKFIEEGEGYKVIKNPFGATLRALSSMALDPLTDSQQAVFDYLKSSRPKIGKEISKATRIPLSTLQRHIFPALRSRGLKNRRGVGYFIEPE